MRILNIAIERSNWTRPPANGEAVLAKLADLVDLGLDRPHYDGSVQVALRSLVDDALLPRVVVFDRHGDVKFLNARSGEHGKRLREQLDMQRSDFVFLSDLTSRDIAKWTDGDVIEVISLMLRITIRPLLTEMLTALLVDATVELLRGAAGVLGTPFDDAALSVLLETCRKLHLPLPTLPP